MSHEVAMLRGRKPIPTSGALWMTPDMVNRANIPASFATEAEVESTIAFVGIVPQSLGAACLKQVDRGFTIAVEMNFFSRQGLVEDAPDGAPNRSCKEFHCGR
jgi:hypothetical protein